MKILCITTMLNKKYMIDFIEYECDENLIYTPISYCEFIQAYQEYQDLPQQKQKEMSVLIGNLITLHFSLVVVYCIFPKYGSKSFRILTSKSTSTNISSSVLASTRLLDSSWIPPATSLPLSFITPAKRILESISFTFLHSML